MCLSVSFALTWPVHRAFTAPLSADAAGQLGLWPSGASLGCVVGLGKEEVTRTGSGKSGLFLMP